MRWWDEWRQLKEPEIPLLWACGWSEAILALIPALLHQALFDWAVPSGNPQHLLLVLGLLIGAETLAALAMGLGDLAGGLRIERMDARFKTNLLGRIWQWGTQALDGLGYGALLKGLEDSEKLTERAHALGAITARALPAILTSVPLMFFLSWPLALLRLLVLPLNYKLGSLFSRRDLELERKVWSRQRTFHTLVQETYEGIKTLKVNSASEAMHREVELAGLRVRETGSQRRSWATLWNFSVHFLNHAGSVLVFFLAATLIAFNQLSFGRFMAFQVISSQAVMSLGMLLGVSKTLFVTSNHKQRYQDLMDRPIERQHGARPIGLGRMPLIQTLGMGFSYPNGSQALRKVNMSIWPGERIALVGPSGCGKTTLAHLFLALYPHSEGQLLWEGIPYQQIAPRHLRQQMAAVLQYNSIWSGTLRYNLCLNDHSFSESQLEESLELAGLLDWVRSLPEGLDTVWGADGIRISGGQMQRLALARAFLRKPRLLVLDEATSALDRLTESFIQDSLRSIPASTTVVTIAHRLNTIQDADCIYVMNQGRLMEAGRHEALLRFGGFYAQLYAQPEEAVRCN